MFFTPKRRVINVLPNFRKAKNLLSTERGFSCQIASTRHKSGPQLLLLRAVNGFHIYSLSVYIQHETTPDMHLLTTQGSVWRVSKHIIKGFCESWKRRGFRTHRAFRKAEHVLLPMSSCTALHLSDKNLGMVFVGGLLLRLNGWVKKVHLSPILHTLL